MTTTHIMLDIETLGTRPGFVVLSAALVRFSDLQATSVNLSIYEQRDLGLDVDNDTHAWWGTQAPEAWAAATQGALPLASALPHLVTWLAWAAGGSDYLIWCHGASFDAPLLGEVFRRAGMPVPWTFRNIRDTRTLYDLAGIDVRQFYAGLRPHVAVDDAVGQTRAAIEALRILSPDNRIPF